MKTTSTMKRWRQALFALLAMATQSLSLAACGGDDEDDEGGGGSSGGGSTTFKNEKFTVGGVSFTMVAVEGGTFRMGAQNTNSTGDNYDAMANADEAPVHSVTLGNYHIGETEVTQELWEAVMGSNPSSFSGSNLPVESVSWNDCQEFVTKLNQATGKAFRLPTEAEWEYAARGGKESQGYQYAGSNTIGDVAWYVGNSGEKPHAVKSKKANELGIYDMSGNVWEWCSDWWAYYPTASQANPKGGATGTYRVNRGGSWYYDARYGRVAVRFSSTPTFTSVNLGLRLAL